MCREAAATEPFVLEPVGYRETRSVGMLVLADPSGHAASLADRVQRGLEHLGVYEPEHRAWLPHVTCLRFRARPDSIRRCPRSGRSRRPASLLCFHACIRQGRGTRCWSRVR